METRLSFNQALQRTPTSGALELGRYPEIKGYQTISERGKRDTTRIVLRFMELKHCKSKSSKGLCEKRYQKWLTTKSGQIDTLLECATY